MNGQDAGTKSAAIGIMHGAALSCLASEEFFSFLFSFLAVFPFPPALCRWFDIRLSGLDGGKSPAARP